MLFFSDESDFDDLTPLAGLKALERIYAGDEAMARAYADKLGADFVYEYDQQLDWHLARRKKEINA